MDIITMKEEPLFRKCCFFIPLQFCLQTWAYLKVVTDIITISYLLLVVAILYPYKNGGFFKEWSLYHVFTLMILALLVDFGFLITLITGLIKKKYSILRVFYLYEFFAMLFEAVFMTVLSVQSMKLNVAEGIFVAVVGLFLFLIDICIILTLKCEMVKLRNKEQYDFARMPASNDAEATGKFTTDEE